MTQRIQHRILAATILLVVGVLLNTGCVSDFKITLPVTDTGVLVVEGYILENSKSEFSFSRSFSINEDAPPFGYNEVRLNLYVVGDNGYRSEQASYLGKGVYQIEIGLLDDDVAYGIEFEYDGDTYRSGLTKPVYTPEFDLSFDQPQKDADVSILVSTHNEREEKSYYIWKYNETWEFTADYMVRVFFDMEEEKFYQEDTPVKYYCWNSYNGYEVLIGSTEKLKENHLINHKLYDRPSLGNRFSVLYRTYITQRGISKSAYEYYLDLSKTNEEMGGLFSPLPSGIEGNIICTNDETKKVIGFVDVSKNIAERELYIARSEITRTPPYVDCEQITKSEVDKRIGNLGITLREFIETYSIHPAVYNIENREDEWVWTNMRCIDCTFKGGTKNKPNFWPNDHN